MPANNIKIVLDTNWYISATINKKSRRMLFSLLTNPTLIILFSDEILAEYRQVMARNKFNKIISSNQVTRFMNLVISKLEIIKIKTAITGSRDTKDNFLLSLSVDGAADYLITGDSDLLVLRNISSTQIITLSKFLEIISDVDPG